MGRDGRSGALGLGAGGLDDRVEHLDQQLDVTDKFDKDGVCYVQLEGGEKTIYMTIKRGNGFATSTMKYISPDEFN